MRVIYFLVQFGIFCVNLIFIDEDSDLIMVIVFFSDSMNSLQMDNQMDRWDEIDNPLPSPLDMKPDIASLNSPTSTSISPSLEISRELSRFRQL